MSKEEFVSKLNTLGIPTHGLGFNNVIEFNPNNESTKLLSQWLTYRGITYRNLQDVKDVSILEIARPGKPFSGFTSFDPNDATVEFMKAWLSQFGIGGNSNDRTWWIKRTKKMLKLLNSLSKMETMKQKFQRLIELRKKLKAQNRKMALLNLQLTRLINIEPEMKTKPNYEIPDKNILFAKQLLAKAFDATAIAFPIFFYQIQKKPNANKTDFVSSLKEEVPKIAAKSFIISTYSPNIADAVLKDIDRGSFFPFEITKELAKNYLTSHPKLFQILTGIVVPSLTNILYKTKK